MNTKVLIISILIFLITVVAMAQAKECTRDFDFLVKKVHDDYPGYHDKVTAKTQPQLADLEKKVRLKIIKTPDSCGYYMKEYTNFFCDHHLSVRRVWKDLAQEQQQPEIMSVSTYGRNININADSLSQVTIHSKKIEGVWQGFSDEFAIVRQSENHYAAVAISCQGWEPGQVMSEFETVNDSVYTVTNYSLIKGTRPYQTIASLHLSGKIFEIHDDTRYVRKTESEVFNKATLYSYVPLYPNGKNTYPVATYLSDSTFYLRIPDFYSNTANELVIKHWNEITTRPNLIIDIRNNGGGQDNYYEELAKIVYSRPYESKGVEWYASVGNIKLFEEALKNGEIRDGEEGIRQTKELIAVMKKNIGGFVTYPESANDSSTVRRDTVYTMPRKIGIIINEGNASSAEQFLLAAKESDKVILFGNTNTAGVLDYSNITPTILPSGNFELWCPMTRSKRLPEKPIDNIGIAPDVIIPFLATDQLFDKLDNWVYFVKNYLEISK